MHRWCPALAALVASALAACGGSDGDGGTTTPPPTGFTVSGTITAAAGQTIDSDTADRLDVPKVRNDTPAAAQPATFASVIGGFAGTHPYANGQTFTDAQDLYRVTLAAGQVVFLDVANADTGDLDLCLLDPATLDPVAPCSDSSTASREQVAAPRDGELLVQVAAASGGSSYVVSFANVAAGAVAAAAAGWPEFVPGELLVRFRDAPRGLAAARAGEGPRARAAALGLEPLSGGEGGGPVRVALGASDASRARALAALGVERPLPGAPGASLDPTMAARVDTLRARKALRARPDVESADLNYVFRPAAGPPPNELYPLQWHYPLVNLPQAWDAFADAAAAGQGVVVGVIDTGAWLDHPDLAGQLVQGYDFITNVAQANDGDGPDGNPDDPGDAATLSGSSWHGTHVSGTIAAAWRAGVDSGAAGVAPGARVMPLRALGVDGGTSADVNEALRFAAGLASAGGRTLAPAERPAILNLSLGCVGCESDTDRAVYGEVRAAGIVVVAAAGNESSTAPSYPASYPGVISVSAVDLSLARASYSNTGPNIDVAAPGGNVQLNLNADGYPDGVLSAVAGNEGTTRVPAWRFYQGTSMAAPHVAGIVALMKSVCPSLSPDQLDAILESGAMTRDLGAAGKDPDFGFGLVDALAAVQAAADSCGKPIPPGVEITPPVLDFEGATSELEVVTRKTGGSAGDGFEITGASTNAPWLTVAPRAGATLTGGFGPYTVRVDRSELPAGRYAATARFTRSDGRTVDVPVTMQVGGGEGPGDTGFLYVLLVSDETPPRIRQVLSPGGATVAYSFSGLAAGRYFLVATTDFDDDLTICDDGEVCGAWPTLGLLTPLDVTEDLPGRDFAVGLEVTLGLFGAAGAPGPDLRGLRLERAADAGGTR